MDKKGITLVELLIVVAIIGILAAVAIPGYIGQQRRAARTEASSNLQNIRLLMEQDFSENATYIAANGTSYTEAVTTLQTALPGFRPGNAADLNYDYAVASTATTFTAVATAKAGKRVAGDAICTINENNVRSGPCW